MYKANTFNTPDADLHQAFMRRPSIFPKEVDELCRKLRDMVILSAFAGIPTAEIKEQLLKDVTSLSLDSIPCVSIKEAPTFVELFLAGNSRNLCDNWLNYPKSTLGPKHNRLIRNLQFNYGKEVFREANDYVERVIELCAVVCPKGRTMIPTPQQIDRLLGRYLIICYTGFMIDEMKFSVNQVFLSYYKFDPLLVPLPKKPFFLGLKLFPNILRHMLVKKFFNSNRTFEKDVKIYTIFQGFKKGLLPVRPEKVQSSLKDHAKALSIRSEPLDTTILDCIERTTTDLFHNISIGKRFPAKTFISSKSTIESDYSSRGALGRLIRICRAPNLVLSYEFFGYLSWGPEWDKHLAVRGPWLYCGDLWEAAQLYILSNLSEEPKSQPCCILEPMKVRIITKPKWNQYLGLKDVQHKWWSNLKHSNYGFFDLVGGVVTPYHIERISQSMKLNHGLCSGDYTAATDNLKMEVTTCILKHMVHGQDLELMTTLSKALTGGSLLYPCTPVLPQCNFMRSREFKWNGKNLTFPLSTDEFSDFLDTIPDVSIEYVGLQENYKIQQHNGQLMGSIVSFILLCIANLSAYRYALESFHKREFSLQQIKEEFPVLINGDDILFSCSKEFYLFWKESIKQFGFFPSMGKNLWSREVCQINSVLYNMSYFHDYSTGISVSLAKEVPYVNFGLITNRKKQDCEVDSRVYCDASSVDKSLNGRLSSLDMIQKELLRDLPVDIKRQANRLFINHQDWIRKVFPGINICYPLTCGGFGLDDIGLDELHESKSERSYRLQWQRFLFLKQRNFKQYILHNEVNPIIAKISMELGNHFPELRLRAENNDNKVVFLDNTSSVEAIAEWSPTTRFWRGMDKIFGNLPVSISNRLTDCTDRKISFSGISCRIKRYNWSSVDSYLRLPDRISYKKSSDFLNFTFPQISRYN